MLICATMPEAAKKIREKKDLYHKGEISLEQFEQYINAIKKQARS